MAWVNRLANLFRRRRLNREVEEEVRFHLDARIRDNIAAGMTPVEARQDAVRRFGGAVQAEERTRDADLVVWLDSLGKDVTFALRNLRKNPGVTSVAVLSLALGIGANTAIFSSIQAVLLRPLPYKDPSRLAMLWMDNRRLALHEDLTSFPNYEDWAKSTSFEDMAAFTPTDNILTGLEEPMRVTGTLVTANFLRVLGVTPAFGRNFTPEEEQPGRNRVAIIGYGLWQHQFAADPHVLGKNIELDGQQFQIAGVMPNGFAFPSQQTQIWTPLALQPRQRASRSSYFLNVIGRMKPDVPFEQARSEMTRIGANLEQQYPDQNRGYGVWVVPLLTQTVGRMREALLLLLGSVGFVLLIACLNVANLFLGRGAARGREIAVRAALGAGRRRLIRQLLTESTVLSLLAGGLAVAIAFWAIRGVILLAPKDLPRLDQIAIDIPVLAFTLAVSLMAGVLFGIAPALWVSRVDLNDALREGGRSMSGTKRLRWIRSALTVAEVAFSMILLTGAGLMIRTMISLQSVQPGFRTNNVLTWRIAPSRVKYTTGAQVATFYGDLLRSIQSIPGVQAAAAVTDVFLSTTPNSGGFAIEGRPSPPPEQQIEATIDRVSSNYFVTLGVPLLHGRFFDSHDGRDTPPVIIINETMAHRFWPNEDAVGKRFKFGDASSPDPWLTVVGVVGDMRRQGQDKLARCETFMAMAQRPARGMILVVDTSSEPEKIAGMLRDAVRRLDKSAVLFERSTIADQIGESLAQRRFQTFLLGLFALLALVLAAAGIYGVVYQSVSQRTSELGIRVALGAQKANLLRMIVGEALGLVFLGAITGGLAAFAISRTLSSFLYSVTAADPLTYAAVLSLLAVAAILASVVPARRATVVDPIEALRYE